MHPICVSLSHSCCISSPIHSRTHTNAFRIFSPSLAARLGVRDGGSTGVQARLKAEEIVKKDACSEAHVGRITGDYGDERRRKHRERKTVHALLSGGNYTTSGRVDANRRSSFTRSGLHIQQRSSKHAASARKEKASPVLEFDGNDSDDEASEDEDNDILDMAEWIKKKPAGFGEGKLYDTSLEDRLLEEIKRDQQAQAVSQNKNPKPTVKPTQKPGNDVPPDGVEVFVKNLPRKKNVERDMRVALRSVSGLLHVRPLVSGNEKTREPVCKGLAFLTFATLDDAEEFIERYNGESLLFGKVEKQIVCELARSSNPCKQIFPGQSSKGPRLGVRDPSSGDLFVRSPANPSTREDVVTVDSAAKVKKLLRSFPSPEVKVVEGLRGGDDLAEEDGAGSLEEEDDADLLMLEQEIWNELEDEEDFELDLELEAEVERCEETTRSLSGEVDSFTVTNLEDIRDENESLPQVTGQGFGRSKNRNESGEDDSFLTRKVVGSSDEKETKIRELEAKLEELQAQLNKKDSVFSKANEAVSVREEFKIEALEKRLLRRTKASKGANVSKGKLTSLTGKTAAKKGHMNSMSASEKPSKEKKPKSPPQLKLGASSRLRKREREIFSEALSNYSAPSRE